MNQVRKSVMLIIFGVVIAVFGVNDVFFSYTDNTPQRQQMLKASEAKKNFQQTKAHVISPMSSTRTVSTAQPPPFRAEAMDKSALPNEFTIPSELLYLDDQPIEFDSETNDQSLRKNESETQAAEEIDAILPDADTIPTELLELDNEPSL